MTLILGNTEFRGRVSLWSTTNGRSMRQRGLAAFGAYCVVAGASFFTMPQICALCGGDNAYLGEIFLGAILALIGAICGLTWLNTGRREGSRGLADGGVAAVAVGAIVVVIGAARTLVPSALFPIDLVFVVAGFALTGALIRLDDGVFPVGAWSDDEGRQMHEVF